MKLKRVSFVQFISIALILIMLIPGCKKTGDRVTKQGLTEGTYVLSDNENHSEISISFDLSDYRFSFTALGNEFMSGTIKIENQKVTATNDDNNFYYVFEIKDSNTICFVSDESSELMISVGSVLKGESFKPVDSAEVGKEMVLSNGICSCR